MPETGSPASTPAAPPLLRVAHVRRVHGVRGEVRVQMLGGDLARFAPGTELQGERDGRRLTVAASRPLDGDEILLTFAELPTREDAARLSGEYLCVGTSQARALPADEWFVWQLVGLRAVSDAGEELGVVSRRRGATGERRHRRRRAAGGERRFPLVREWVRTVDLARGVVVVTPWPEDEG